MAQRRDWLLGSIEPLLLYLINEQPMYGYQAIKELEKRSQCYFRFKEGTLYPVLQRMEKAGLILGQWHTLPTGRRRKYYNITEKGRATLAERARQWQKFSSAVDLVATLPVA